MIGPGSSVGCGVLRFKLDTADTGTVSGDGEPDVASLSPAGAPGVLDDPVLLAGLGVSAVADGEYGVVESGTALGIVINTGLVG